MLNRIALIPYKMGSTSCKKLQQELQKAIRTLRFTPQRYQLRKKRRDFVLYWGKPNSIASNKLTFFQAASRVEGLNIPEFTTDPTVAKAWDKEYLGRTSLTSHSGQGIVQYAAFETPRYAPLYVQYIKKMYEYRVHVYNGQVIDIVQKKRRSDTENINSQIRSHANGWVFCREDLKINNKNDLINQALLACNVAGLDFGAVDIIYNAHQKKYYVLEVNTAPGLEGQTIINYTQAILNHIQGLNHAEINL